MRIFITGDTHGDFSSIHTFCEKMNTTVKDILIIVGDSGINYNINSFHNSQYSYEDTQENLCFKNYLSYLPITLFCIQGNHEALAELVKGYHLIQNVHPLFKEQSVFLQDNYPNILFANEGEVYNFLGKSVAILGGAYSVDKNYRIAMNRNWFPEEQPVITGKDKLFLKNLETHNWKVDIVLSHTCPFHYMPTEMFLSGIQQDLVDNTTEEFLEHVEKKLNYKQWYCGHFHTDKTVDKIKFLFHNIITFIEDNEVPNDKTQY